MSLAQHFSVEGKTAVIAGASSGLGAEFARTLAEAGAHVALGARRTERLDALASAIVAGGGQACVARADVTEPGDCESLVRHAMDRFGGVDILVNCAGISNSAPATREDPEEFRRVIDVNLMGAYWMAQSCGRVMPPGSSIINVGSILGGRSVGLPLAAYTSSKAAIVGLSRDLAQQWSGRKGIRVNTLIPGFFPTDMTAEMDAQFVEGDLVPNIPMGRLGTLQECAMAMLFLASPASSYITGTELVVDGGLTIGC